MNNDDWYDVMQVCLNGHKITEYAKSQSESRQNHCAECGERTLDACPGCGSSIRGYRHIGGVFHLNETLVPKYCIDCGAAFPWQLESIENLTAILGEGALSQQDMEEVQAALPDLVRETARTESASLKTKRILGKLGKPVYEVAIKVISDVASETAKKTMGL